MTRSAFPFAGAAALAGSMLAGSMLAGSAPAAASDFGLDYAVERVPASQLSLAQCASAIRRGSQAAGYLTRIDQDQSTLRTFVSGPKGDGHALVAYCVQAGGLTVYVVQVLDYSGPGGREAQRAKQAVVAELKKASAAPRTK